MQLILAATLAIMPLLAKKYEILSRLRTHGQFAGAALEGATQREALHDNAELYGKWLVNREILTSPVHTSRAAAKLIAELCEYPARNSMAAAAAGSQ